MNNEKMILNLNDEMMEKINNYDLKMKDMIKFLLNYWTENKDLTKCLNFKMKDIEGDLTKENVHNQLSITQLYNDNNKNIKNATIDRENKTLILEF